MHVICILDLALLDEGLDAQKHKTDGEALENQRQLDKRILNWTTMRISGGGRAVCRYSVGELYVCRYSVQGPLRLTHNECGDEHDSRSPCNLSDLPSDLGNLYCRGLSLDGGAASRTADNGGKYSPGGGPEESNQIIPLDIDKLYKSSTSAHSHLVENFQK